MRGKSAIRRIGLTGSIASGKSCASEFFVRHGIPVVDADLLSREAVEIGSNGLRSIATHFGAEKVLREDGHLNRKALGDIVFQDETQRQWLNAFLHPEIARMAEERMEQYQNAGEAVVIFDAALLFEAELEWLVDEVVLIDCEDNQREERLMRRDGLSKEEAAARMRSQMPREAKQLRADWIIDNSGEWKQTEKQLAELLNRWQKER